MVDEFIAKSLANVGRRPKKLDRDTLLEDAGCTGTDTATGGDKDDTAE